MNEVNQSYMCHVWLQVKFNFTASLYRLIPDVYCATQTQCRSNHESQNTDAQGTRAPTTTLYVLCGLQEGVRLNLP